MWLPKCWITWKYQYSEYQNQGLIYPTYFLYCCYWHVAQKHTHTTHRCVSIATVVTLTPYKCLYAYVLQADLEKRTEVKWGLVLGKSGCCSVKNHITVLVYPIRHEHITREILFYQPWRHDRKDNVERALNVGFREFPHILQTNPRTALHWG